MVMKKLVFIFSLAACFATAGNAATPLHAAPQSTISTTPIHPRNVNRLLKIAADYWDLTLGQAKQAYNSGNLTITYQSGVSPSIYMIEYGGFCILAALEDKL